jgi:hypothetical protein
MSESQIASESKDRVHVLNTSWPDRLATVFLSRVLPFVVLACCVAALATWVPHYLTWSWWPDLDAYASMAHCWDAGQLPYRDVVAFNFPGQIYIFWLLGKIFGWGRTFPIYAVDAFMLISLGAIILVWSVRRFRRLLPGAIGYAAFLSYYLGLDSNVVAQRDWHCAFLAISGLLLMQAFPGRWGRLVGAIGMGLAIAFRPYAILYVPAAFSAAREDSNGTIGDWKQTIITWFVWIFIYAVFAVLAFAPLIWNGLLGDFVRGVRLATYGGSYSNRSPLSLLLIFAKQFITVKFTVVVILLAVMSQRAEGSLGQMTRTWLIAMLMMFLYKPIAPVAFDYHVIPLMLVFSIGLAVLVGLVLLSSDMTLIYKLMAVLLMFALAVPDAPKNCSVSESLKALRALTRGERPNAPPPGCLLTYTWADCGRTLDYLRDEIPAGTRVANLLHKPTSLCGPAGRLPVFLYEANGPVWLWVANFSSQEDWVKDLEATKDSVVVWVPDEVGPPRPPWLTGDDPEFKLAKLSEAVRRLYDPLAKFGVIEIWKRKPGG